MSRLAVWPVLLLVGCGCEGVRITTTSLPEGAVGQPYEATLEARDGQELSWAIHAGALPDGLALTPDGQVAGLPIEAGEFAFTAEVSSPDDGSDRKGLVLNVGTGTPSIQTPALPPARIGHVYSQVLDVLGGLAPLSFESVLEPLPEGIELAEEGVLSGRPEEDGSFPLRLRVSDAKGLWSERDFVLVVNSELVLLTDGLPAARVGVPYDQLVAASGGAPPYAFSVASGELPQGLSLEAAGRLQGVPVTAGGRTFEVQVEDREDYSVQRMLRLEVQRAPFVVDVEPDVELPGTCDVVGEASFAAEIDVPTAGMVDEVDVAVAVTFDDTAFLTLALESPTGKRAVLFFGDTMTEGDDGVDAFYDDVDEPATPLEQLRGEPAQGVWLLVATVTPSAWAGCTEGGSIDSVELRLTLDDSGADYSRALGWNGNNLILGPWARISGGGLVQDSITFTVHRWNVGPNGLAEGGAGDDVDLGAVPLEWSADLDPIVGIMDSSGAFASGAETGEGTVTGTDGVDTYEYVLKIVPPDWVP